MNGGLILSLAYGIRVLSKNDPFITLSERASESLQSLSNPCSFLVDSIPLFRYILEYLPGAKRMARERRLLAAKLRDAPFAAAQKDIVGVSFYLPTAVLTVFRSHRLTASPLPLSCHAAWKIWYNRKTTTRAVTRSLKILQEYFFLVRQCLSFVSTFFQEIPKLGQARQVLLYIR